MDVQGCDSWRLHKYYLFDLWMLGTGAGKAKMVCLSTKAARLSSYMHFIAYDCTTATPRFCPPAQIVSYTSRPYLGIPKSPASLYSTRLVEDRQDE